MKKDGKSIIIITHKLNEVMAISDRVAILRKGEYIGVVDTATTTQSELTEKMVGRPISLEINRPPVENREERLRVVDLTCLNGDGIKALKNINFKAYAGEILGVAGIAGSGQNDRSSGYDTHRHDTQQALGIHLAIFGLQPNAAFKFIRLLYKICSLAVMQTGFTANDDFLNNHTKTLP